MLPIDLPEKIINPRYPNIKSTKQSKLKIKYLGKNSTSSTLFDIFNIILRVLYLDGFRKIF